MPDKIYKESIKKKDGFKGQKAIVLPKQVINVCQAQKLLSNLYITDIGFYPRAEYHYREREQGCNQNILIYCTSGMGWFTLDGKTVPIKEGEYLVIPKNLKHRYGADEKLPWSIYWAHFNGAAAQSFVELLLKNCTDHVGYAAYNEKEQYCLMIFTKH
ncbi:AraC family ligand binding domain-containing protein [Niabella ginsengisoli]|uniref:AraC family ligand binding domain-containing protein n=1 Tax=Niabella ginsengisoli TaxID=522298 RepID=A0ABS9SLA2_9BACT|nr:AraC family ligand binding domain-containing protein [Niabella ginsengisoli]MCH5599120.1 AraC family ligand binding domain-containing protein [Niabella ginsengisoli]